MRRKVIAQIAGGLVLSLVLAGVVAADITGDLVGYWPLDGDAVDASGNGLDGTINGSVTPAPDRMGYADSAMSFPGEASSNITVDDSPLFNITGEITLAAWVFLNSTNENNARIIAKAGGGGSRAWSLNIELTSGGVANPATFQVGINGGASNLSVVDTQSLPTDEWAHMTGVYRPGEVTEIYVNGELHNTNTTNVPASQHSDNGLSVMIGSRNACGNCGWDGFIDEARVYVRALSPDDIKELFAYHPAPRVKAWGPEPSDGAGDVLLPLLKWKPGVTAVLHDVYFGTDPNLGPDDLVQAHGPLPMYYHAPGITPGTTYYWRVDEIEPDMTTVHTGDVWSFTAMPYTAYLPNPADGDNDVAPDPNLTLSWQAGREALKHQVYFGSSFTDVNAGAPATDKGVLTETSFILAETLEPVTPYYWRVDEIGVADVIRAGQVWAFATFRAVDDFESYTDDEGNRIYETWIDGYTNGTNGSTVGYLDAPFAEQTVVHSGGQSMPLDYNNVNAPYYSEAEREFDPVQDWTRDEVDTLVVSVRGRPGNAADTLYVTVKDSSGRSATVVYADPGVFTATRWLDWKIPLNELSDAGVNLTRVETLIIGIGDRANPTAGGAGLLFIDDIRVTRPVTAQ